MVIPFICIVFLIIAISIPAYEAKAGYFISIFSIFFKIVGSALDASRYKMEMLANLNVVAAQTMGVSIGNVAQSYYQDAFFGIAIGRLSIVFQELSVTFREWDRMIGTHCKVDEITDGGRCL